MRVGKHIFFLQSSVVDFQNFKLVGFYKMCSNKCSLLSFISVFSFLGKKIIYMFNVTKWWFHL